MQEVEVSLLPVLAKAESADLAGAAVVVFDVLRATSSIVTALAAGYEKVYPVVDRAGARRLAEQVGGVLAGERGGEKIAGFTYGNSPWEFWLAGVPGPGRGLVLTTSNGTRAIDAARGARLVLAGSLLNARAAAKAAVQARGQVVLLCAGSGGGFALEDFLGAGMVLVEMSHILGRVPPMTDEAAAAWLLAKRYERQPLAGILACGQSKKLLDLGYGQDLYWCAQLNRFALAPVLRQNYISL